jgi:hypothetical protein
MQVSITFPFGSKAWSINPPVMNLGRVNGGSSYCVRDSGASLTLTPVRSGNPSWDGGHVKWKNVWRCTARVHQVSGLQGWREWWSSSCVWWFLSDVLISTFLFLSSLPTGSLTLVYVYPTYCHANAEPYDTCTLYLCHDIDAYRRFRLVWMIFSFVLGGDFMLQYLVL